MASRNFDIEQKLAELRAMDDPTLDAEEVVDIVENVITTLGSKNQAKIQDMVGSLTNVASAIQKMRDDVASIKPADVKEYDISAAHDELDAVIKATEEATNTILDATEVIQNEAANVEGDEQQKIMDQTMIIFEASNFQDITGQRINKVVGTLQVVEETVEKMLKAFGGPVAAVSPEPPEKEVEGDEALLGGPQLPENANSQDDIDAILASFD